MGNLVSNRNSQPRVGPRGRVILWDGSVREFEPPLTAAELMLDHPQQAVVEFSSAVAGKRPAALPADASLEAAKLYLMLPMKRGGGGGSKASALSGDDIRRVIAAADSILRSPGPGPTASFLPLLARVCVAVNSKRKREERRETTTICEEKKVSFVGMESFMEEERGGDVYLSRQVSGKRGNWKPSLDTIPEKVIINNNNNHNNNILDHVKISHWLF